MTPYTVYYKKIGGFFWKKIKRVKGDSFVENGYSLGPNNIPIGTTKDIRWFILEDETRIEIPCNGIIFKFSSQRFLNIKRDMEKDAGRTI